MTAHLGDQLVFDGRAVELAIEQGQALGLLLDFFERRGARDQQHAIGDMGVGNPDLFAVDPVAARHAFGAGLEAGGVEPGVGFGHGKTHFLLARNDRRDHALLLFLGAEQDHRFEPEHRAVDAGGRSHAATALRHGLHHHGCLGDAKARSAHRLWHGNAEPAGIGHRLVEVGRIFAAAVVFQPVVVAELRAVLEHRLADVVLVFGEGEIQLFAPVPYGASPSSGCFG